MKSSDLRIAEFILIFAACSAAVFGQNRFEGYALTVDAGSDGSCPIHYQPNDPSGFSIQVFLAGTGQKTNAPNISACDGSKLGGNRVGPNGFGKWCFQGTEPIYDIKLTNGTTYLWYPITKETGFYNVKDFRPVTRSEGIKTDYTFNDPPDYTQTIRNAVAFIASRQGGTLRFPDGDYIVGTLDGNARDPKYQAITLPSGIVIQGASSNASIPSTNVPTRTSSTRIRLRNDNQAIFRIGGCTNQVRVRDIELLGNSAFYGEARRSSAGTYGIEAVGMAAVNPMTGAETDNASQIFKFENVTFQELNKGIYLHNLNDQKCDSRVQRCNDWHFDYIDVDHCFFSNNNSGIWIDTHNTNWRISNSFFGYMTINAPGDGIHIERAGMVLIEQCFGGGYNNGANIGGTFIRAGAMASLTIINSESENEQRSIFNHPGGADSALRITVIGSIFGSKIELHGPLNYVSSGNLYGPKNIIADPAVSVTSIGDHFCLDPRILPGLCKDETGKPVTNPGFDQARVMFRTGSVGEGFGQSRIDGRGNFFGYDVEINKGLMQYDPDTSFNDLTAWALNPPLRPQLKDGALVYCKDCKKNTTGLCSQGKAGTDGAFAKRINGQWRCD